MSNQTLNLSGVVTDPATGYSCSFSTSGVLAGSAAPPATTTTSPSGGTVTATVYAGPLPGRTASGPYASDAWLSTFTREASGNIDLTPLIPDDAVYISTSTTPGHLASDYADFNSAQDAAIANGSICILFRDGGVYPVADEDQNVQGATGTAAHPFIISRIGRNGFTDHSLPRPVLQGRLGVAGAPGNGKAWGGPIHYVIIDGLDFNCTNLPSGTSAPSGPALSFVDTALGASSDHIGIFDVTATGYQRGIDLESDDGSVTPSYTINTVILDGVSVYNCRGGPDDAGFYANCIYDLCVNRSYFIGCGAKNQQGTAHDVYVNGNPSLPQDSQIRFINCVFGAAAAVGCECNRGGYFHDCVSLANPIALYGGGGAPMMIDGVIVDGGASPSGGTNEFDATPVQFSSAQGYAQQSGGTLSLQPGNEGSGRGWGAYSDCASSATIQNLYCINKNDAADIAAGNTGFAVGAHCTDSGKNPEGMPTSPNGAPVNIGPNVVVHNWDDVAGSNQVNLSQTTAPLPAVTFTAPVVLPGVTETTIVPSTSPAVAITNASAVSGVEPQYVDDTRCCSTYAKTLGISGVEDGPTLLMAMAQQNSANWTSQLEAGAAVEWIAAGFSSQGSAA